MDGRQPGLIVRRVVELGAGSGSGQGGLVRLWVLSWSRVEVRVVERRLNVWDRLLMCPLLRLRVVVVPMGGLLLDPRTEEVGR